MKEVIGDFWEWSRDFQPDAIVCTTNKVVKGNGRLVMGAGIAKEFRNRYEDLDLDWGKRLKLNQKLNVMVSLTYEYTDEFKSPLYLVAFPTKYDWKKNSHHHLITLSCKSLKNIADIFDWRSILMTRPGCGNGGLNWFDVKHNIIDQILDDRFTIVSKD